MSLPSIRFDPRFIQWIQQHQKRATTRLSAEESSELQPGSLCNAVNAVDDTVFAQLRITQIIALNFADIDDELARIENCKDSEELKQLLQVFYPNITDSTELKVYHFQCISQ